MSLEMSVHEQSCRGCELCVDICPTHVLEMDPEKGGCFVKHAEDCIACLSCSYLCPSGAIEHRNYHAVKNFYRDEDFCSKTGRFL